MSKVFRGFSVLLLAVSVAAFAIEETKIPLPFAFVPCKGTYVLCYYAKCKLNNDGTASCGCRLFNDKNSFSLIEINNIFPESLKKETLDKCPNGLASCPSGDAPICQTMQNSLMSTFSSGDPVYHYEGAMACGTGKYANCMTALCEDKVAFDGSPITCTCRVRESEFEIAKTKNNDCKLPSGMVWSGNPPLK